MATINQIPMTLMGNLVSDLEPKRTAGGKTVVNFRVAQTSVTEKNGKWEDGETTFIRCVAYGILADHMIASGIRKGTRVIVSGRYVQRDWQTETGERRSSYELNVDDLAPPSVTPPSRSPRPPPTPACNTLRWSNRNSRRPSQRMIHGPLPHRTSSPNHRSRPSRKSRRFEPMKNSWALFFLGSKLIK